jgi:ABC-type taurine transport system ATPase subunit
MGRREYKTISTPSSQKQVTFCNQTILTWTNYIVVNVDSQMKMYKHMSVMQMTFMKFLQITHVSCAVLERNVRAMCKVH